MSGRTKTVFVGRRGGEIVGVWSERPAMLGLPRETRTQDADLVFEEVAADRTDVVAFAARPAPVPEASDIERRVAALEVEVAALKAGGK